MNVWDGLRSNRAEKSEPAGAEVDASRSTARADAGDRATNTIGGERGIASIHHTRSLQSRITHLLAAGLMAVLALGFLAWYYTQTFARRSQANAERASRLKPQSPGEMALPPLGHMDPPILAQVLGPPPQPPSTSAFALESLEPHDARPYSASMSYAQVASSMPTHGAADRRLSGPVFVSATSMGAEGDARTGDPSMSAEGAPRGMPPRESVSSSSALAGLLEPTAMPTVQARVLPTQRLLLPKGAFVDCTLETAIDSSLPGMTTCVTATDTFGADGSVVLLERGTKLVGETRGDVRQGTARVYVLWTEARTPAGVVVPLASPAADELGRAGLPGEVNRHFWERFGAAMLVSVIDGAVQSAAQRSANSEGAVIVNPSSSRDVMTEVLRSTITIPPTVTKPHGDRIAVLVARDLDFRSVYELRPTTARR